MKKEKKSRGLAEKRSEKMIAIGKAAAKMFHRKGYVETSMNDISSAARQSKGGIYHYFSTKNDILDFILTNYMDVILKGLEQDLKQRSGTTEKLRFFIIRHIELYKENMYEAKTLLHDASFLRKRHFNAIAEKEREYYKILYGLVLEFLGSSVPREELTVITFSLLGMCNWIYSWYNPKGPVEPAKLSDIICSIFFSGAPAWTIAHPDFRGDLKREFQRICKREL
jgi:TetR/AcrR family transcriptional regulator, cholesterol catabolism regulator